MLQIISSLVVIYFCVLCRRSMSQAGVALGLVWSLYVLEQLLQQSTPILLQQKYLTNVIVAGVVTLASIQAILRGVLRQRSVPGQLIALLVLMTLCAVSSLWSISPNDTRHQLLCHAPYLITFVFITPICANDRMAITSALDVTIKFGGLIILGLAVSNLGVRGVVLNLYSNGRLNEGNPLEIASYGSTVALCAVLLAFSREKRFLFRLALMTVAGLGLYITVRSQSRGQLLAALVSLLIWLPLINGVAARNSRLFAACAACAVCIAVFFAMQESSFSNRWNGQNLKIAAESRLEPVTRVLTAYRDAGLTNWLVGLGNSASFKLANCYPHNVPVEVLVEEGILGVLAFIYFSLSVLHSGWKVLSSESISPAARFNIGTMLALFTFHGLLTLKQGSLLGSAFYLSFGACLAWMIPRYMLTGKFSNGAQFSNRICNRRVPLARKSENRPPSGVFRRAG
ncbi:MAG: hypothetical protein R3C59_07405 [Planctomycetaceae bacterium]